MALDTPNFRCERAVAWHDHSKRWLCRHPADLLKLPTTRLRVKSTDRYYKQLLLVVDLLDQVSDYYELPQWLSWCHGD